MTILAIIGITCVLTITQFMIVQLLGPVATRLVKRHLEKSKQ
jgi:hypothetical protein